MAKELMMTIKQGNIKVEVPRSELIELQETSDGVCFSFKGGLMLIKTDDYMTSVTKQRMKLTSDSFPTANLEFDLNDYSNPVKAIIE